VWAVGGLAAAAFSCIALSTPWVLAAMSAANEGRDALRAAARSVREEKPEDARSQLARARDRLSSASDRLTSAWVQPARLVPFAGRQIRAAHAIARSGVLLAEAGTISAEALDARPPGGWSLRGGRIDIASLRKTGEILARSVPLVERADEVLAAAPKTWLVGPLPGAMAKANEAAAAVLSASRRGATGLAAAPTLFGADGLRRYIVATANPTELRGTGGLLGYFGMIEADHGAIRLLQASGRPGEFWPLGESALDPPEWFEETWGSYLPTRVWQNINMSADFPTVGRLIVQATRAAPGPVDGVIQVDPFGLRAILGLTGPVTVQGWDGGVTEDNIVPIALQEQYRRFPDNAERDAFGSRLMTAIFTKLTSSDVRLSIGALEQLGAAGLAGNIKIFAADERAQSAIGLIGLAGGLDRALVSTDVLGVYNLNAGENKVDTYLHREISYDVELDPDTGEADGRLRVVIRNQAPSEGEPAYVLGGHLDDTDPGDNKTVLVLLRPRGSSLTGVTVDGERVVATNGTDGPLDAYQLPITVPSGGRRTVEAIVTSSWRPWAPAEDRYALSVLAQPPIHTDDYDITVAARNGWRLTGPASLDGALQRDAIVDPRPRSALLGRFLHNAVVRPLSAVGRVVTSAFD
jgi:hypothetical protein